MECAICIQDNDHRSIKRIDYKNIEYVTKITEK